MKKLTPEEELVHLEKECTKSYERWDDLFHNGGQDPFWEDGVNLNLVRNHIIYAQREMQRICGEIGYFMPEIANRELPPIVDSKYMAKKDAIMTTARKMLAMYQQNSDYVLLLGLRDELTDTQKQTIFYDTVLGYVSTLERAIAKEDYLTMRRYLYNNGYVRSFRNCLDRAKQMSIA